eukprot:scaffold286247_cov17-Tisochrysis_lutea.AAC.2
MRKQSRKRPEMSEAFLASHVASSPNLLLHAHRALCSIPWHGICLYLKPLLSALGSKCPDSVPVLNVLSQCLLHAHCALCLMPAQEVYFGNHWSLEGTSRKKSEICQAIGASALIDDNPGYALECASAGIHVLLYDWQNRYPWSKLPAG